MRADREKIEFALARACMTANSVAVAAQMPQATVKNVIVGRNVRPVTIGRVARALGVDIAEIIEEGK